MSAVPEFAARMQIRDNHERGLELNSLFSTEAETRPDISELRAWARTYLLQNFSVTLPEEQYTKFARAFARAHGLIPDQQSPLYTSVLNVQGKYYLPVSDSDIEGVYNYFARITGVNATPSGFVYFLRNLA